MWQMQKVIRIALACVWVLVAGGINAAVAPQDTRVQWQDWSQDAFAQAKREGKYVVLDLEAVWCHWCHVMDQRTYANPAVTDYLAAHFVAIKVDQDARPDIANRYRDYGWPATIFFAADGSEIAKRSGYIAPDNFLNLLQAIVADPSPETSSQASITTFSGSPLLSDALRGTLQDMHRNSYDWREGGLKLAQKFVDRDSVEYALWLSKNSRDEKQQEKESEKVRQTLHAALALIDPEWGGVYQYSTGGVWSNPHFEKIMSSQAGYLRLYAQAWADTGDDAYLSAATSIQQYINDFLTSPEGAFFTSQDADVIQGKHSSDYFSLSDAERRKKGIPRIDKHRYARENGWMIEALAYLYEVSGDKRSLSSAIVAANWVIENRQLPGGGFSHDRADVAGPYLGDSLAMGNACLALYRATAERKWLSCAADAGKFIERVFARQDAGFYTSAMRQADPVAPVSLVAENIEITRFMNLMQHYTGDPAFRTMAEHGMRYLATPKIATQHLEEAGVLLADEELANAPLHFTVVGSKNDEMAKALYLVALRHPQRYKRIEWLDRNEGELPNKDVQYPDIDRSAAYVCSASRCSVPAFNPEKYTSLIAVLAQP
ncbi:MAG: DUF255 domain-containing protein [Alcanivoracaceae bacterium]|nr:DUF255 domain-containing protein [Alcanivoracaceae bacterium]